VAAERSETPEATILSLSHDGYARDFGLIHERKLTLALDGDTLSGVDRLLPAEELAKAAPEAEFAVRFHLHPRVRAASIEGAIVLELANGETLLFAAEGAVPEIEDSVFFAWPGGARKCAQIVLRGKAAPGAELRWSFRRV
jgi:uncharacterized heparinase superfamily protein